jgi:two-component system heavy metal sensor histidine kinase CusS
LKAQANGKSNYSLGLTTRLVLGYTTAVMLALTIASVSVYHDIRHSLDLEDAENLGDHVKMLRREMAQRPNDLSAATEIILEAAAERRVEKCYGRLRHENGNTVVETPGFSSFAPADGLFPSPVRVSEDVTWVKHSHSTNGIPILLAAARAGRGAQGKPLIYEVVMDSTRAASWLKSYRNEFVVMVIGGTLLSGIMAWFITVRGLDPLRQIVSTMKRVTASGLKERVGTSGQPRELAALAMEFDKMLDRLGDSFERLTLFTANAAHEFRTPLNSLMMATSLTLARERSAEEYRHALTGNLEEFERLKRMVDKLLFLARAENAERILNKTSLDAAKITGGVLDFFSALAEERGITLDCEGEGIVHADETLLRQALANLLSNAL